MRNCGCDFCESGGNPAVSDRDCFWRDAPTPLTFARRAMVSA